MKVSALTGGSNYFEDFTVGDRFGSPAKTLTDAHFLFFAGLTGALALPAIGHARLPEHSVWTAYDLGSSGYVEASAIAEAMMKTSSMKVRIVPSGTSIGRLLPLKQGRATYGFLANELYFASEGTYDFAAPSWGPQDLRVVLARLHASYGSSYRYSFDGLVVDPAEMQLARTWVDEAVAAGVDANRGTTCALGGCCSSSQRS